LDLDVKLANTNEVTAARMGALTDWINGERLDLLLDAIKAKTDNLPADPADDSDLDTQLAAIAGYLDTEVAAILAAVDTEVAAIKAKTDNLPATPAGTGDIPSAASIADAVWDEAIGDHAGVGSTGEQLAAAGAAGDPWATAIPGAYGAGTAGKIVGDNLNAPVGTVDTVADAIKVVVDAIKAVTDLLPNAGALSDLATLAARLTAARAGYLDKLNVSGTLAHSDAAATYKADVSALALDATVAKAATALSSAVWTNTKAGYLDAAVSSVGGGSLTVQDIVDGVLDEAISGHLTAGTVGAKSNTAAAAAGSGAIEWEYTLTRSDTGAPIDGADVWVTSDAAGTVVLASGTTDSFGQVTFYLDAGTVYVWRQKSGYNFTNPDTETVS